MSRTANKVLEFSVPPALSNEVEEMARAERRTTSELLSEMVRVYRQQREQRRQEEERWVMNIIAETKAEVVKNPKSVRELLEESEQLAREGERQLEKLGYKPRDINRLIHECHVETQS